MNQMQSMTSQLLRGLVAEHALDFKFFVTLIYDGVVDKRRTVIKDNWYLKNRFQRWLTDNQYRDNIRMWFFTEVHRKDSDRRQGGYHRHMVMEDPFVFTSMTDHEKKLDLQTILRNQNKSVRLHDEGLDVRLINEYQGGIAGLVDFYLTKDHHQHNEMLWDVIDFKNSDLISKPLLKSLYGKRSHPDKSRQEAVPA